MEKLKLRIDKVLILLISVVGTLSLLFLVFYRLYVHKGDLLFISLAIVIIFLIPCILSVTYFYVDLTKQVYLDKSKNEILIKRNGKEFTICHNDVVESFCVMVNSDKVRNKVFRYPSYKYIVLILNEKKRIYITCLLSDPETIINILNLKCKTAYSDIPFINWFLGDNVLTTKEYEDKVNEYEDNFRDYSHDKLIEIINNKNVYTDYSREAAQRLLKRKK